ncbi:MAG: TIGR00341 family protein [Paludibacteraceae bacterium]|nr:TIGR00341 family protein [Paludibacteraceae bacterium]
MAITKQTLIQYLSKLINLSDHIDTQTAAESIRNNVHFRGPNVFILFFAIIIASVGLNVNSIPVIIGAMLISPLMGPILGFGLGLGTNDTELLKSALRNLAVMVTISIIASTLYFVITPLDLSHPTELLSRTNPSVYDVFIAFFGGLAGILETSRKEKGTVISGVAIATALMPPLCTVGYGIANLDLHFILGALYLFTINSIFIALAAFIGIKLLKYKSVHTDHQNDRRRAWSLTILILFVLVPSLFSALSIVRENNFQLAANQFIDSHHFIGTTYIYNTHIENQTIRFYLAGDKLTDKDRQQFYNEAIAAGFRTDQIILMDEATSDIREKLSDEDLLRQLIQSKDELLEMKDAQIDAYEQLIDNLQKRLEAYESTSTENE